MDSRSSVSHFIHVTARAAWLIELVHKHRLSHALLIVFPATYRIARKINIGSQKNLAVWPPKYILCGNTGGIKFGSVSVYGP